MAEAEKEYRIPVFLKEEDWKYFLKGWGARRRRIRSSATWQRYTKIDRAVSNATADAYLDREEMKYVLYVTLPDYDYLRESLRFVRKAEKDSATVERVRHEFTAAMGDMTEADSE
ncbi:hypothetical protein ACWDWS_02460 [Streptomyces sp. NPDC003328]